MNAALAVLGGFLLGSVPFGYLLVRLLRGQDVRAVGSGNIGATNVGRAIGRAGAVVTLLLDAGKGATAVLAAGAVGAGDLGVAAAGVGAILGHCYTPWLGFRGGKGVATMIGAFLVLSPWALLAVAAAFVVVVAASRYVSLASMVAAAVLPLATWWQGASSATSAAALATLAVVLLRHRDNARRLVAGTEARLGRGTR